MTSSDRSGTAFKPLYRPVFSVRRGSLTVYFALTFAVMMTLITTAIYSSKVEAGKARLSSAARQSTESVFARYDITLSDRYHLYFVDGGCGTDELQTENIVRYLNQASSHLLNPAFHHVLPGSSFLSLKDSSVSLDGITMATDLDGLAFRAQAVQSIKDLPVPDSSETAQNSNSSAGSGSSLSGRSRIDSSEITQYSDVSDMSEGERSFLSSLIRAVNSLNSNHNSLLFSLVLNQKAPVSERVITDQTTGLSDLVSLRHPLTPGIGILDTEGAKEADSRPLFSEYLIRHTNRYGRENRSRSVLDYETEYLIAGKSSDRENLQSVMRKLLTQRHGLNFLYIETNPRMHAQVTRESSNIALLIGQPALEPAIQYAIAYAWSLAESFTDLRSLYSGNRIARIKSVGTWQVPLESLTEFLSQPETFVLDAPGGMNYREALKHLLSTVPLKKLTFRAMDLIELNMRKSGSPNFRFDHCFDAMRLTIYATSQQDIPLSASSGFSFRNRK